jgi:hypothetical protein
MPAGDDADDEVIMLTMGGKA